MRAIAVELARRRGSNVAQAVRAARLEATARLEREHRERDAEARAIIAELHRLRREPVREDVLYDEHGQPRL